MEENKENHGPKIIGPKLFYFIWFYYDRLYTYGFLWKEIEKTMGPKP